jgi:hypothetical protein
MAESFALAGAGAAGGLLVALWALSGLTILVKADLPPWFGFALDHRVFALSAAVAIATALVCGLLPALHTWRSDLESILRQETGRAVGSRRQVRLRRVLLGAEAAFATILLVGAGLFIAGLERLTHVDLGFDAEGVLTFRVDPP